MTGFVIAVWTWGSLGMLAWGLAAAIPLLLHFWSRRRFDEMPWAAMDFLLAALRKNARRLRIEQLVLLLARAAILFLFALALADPMLSWDDGESPAPTLSPTHYLFVVDTSYSMAVRTRDQTRLDTAKQAVADVLQNSQPGDGFSLLLMQDPPQLRLAEATTDRNELTRQLASAEVSHGGANLYDCLKAMNRQLEINRRRHPQLEQSVIVFLTDLGQTTWDAVARSDCRSMFDQLSKISRLSLIDVGERDVPNLAITRFRTERPSITVGETVRLEAEVRAFNSAEVATCRIEFLVDGRLVDSQQVTVPPNGHTIAGSNYRFDMLGDVPLEARLSIDPLTLDNQRWTVLPVHKSRDVLCVQGEPEAADYIGLALNPTESADAPIHATVAAESALLEQPLQRFDCIILSNVARVSVEERNVLHRYVQEGGGLVIVVGDRVEPENYNRLLGDSSQQRLLPARIGRLSQDDVRLFDPLEYKHSVVAAFRGHERAGLLTVPTWCYYELTPSGKLVELALAFDNQQPAIVTEAMGRGRSILVATAMSPSSTIETSDGRVPWSALPTWPSFPPLVDGLVRYATAGRDWPRAVHVSALVHLRFPESASRKARIRLPDQTTRDLDLAKAEGQSRATFSETSIRGIYSVEVSTGSEKNSAFQQRFAVNLDCRESDLTPLSSTRLPTQLQPHAELEIGRPLVPPPSGMSLYRLLLIGVALLLILEGALAGWFGRRSA